MKRVFSIVVILTNFHRCQLGAKNLDLLVLLIKNWHDGPTTRFENKIGFVDFDGFGEVEENILDVIKVPK